VKRGYFVTGTGTGVGKTFVTALLARQAVAAGERVFAFKPIETGCPLVGGRRIGADQELIAQAAGDWQQHDLRNLYCFDRPLAPLAAARLEQRTIDLFHVERTFIRGADGCDLCLVEGAGGWRVPITECADMASLAKRLDLPVVIVGLATLGTINHSLLTIEAVRGDGCDVQEVILSRRNEDDLELARSNASEIRRLSGCFVRLTDDITT
jgi:dethiobiotin synthetase